MVLPEGIAMHRWTYARMKHHAGGYSDCNLTVFMDGKPIGWVRHFSCAGGQAWHWRVLLTQEHGHCHDRDGALNALRSSMLKSLGEN